MQLIYTSTWPKWWVGVLLIAGSLALTGCGHIKQQGEQGLARDSKIAYVNGQDFAWPQSELKEKFASYWEMRFQGTVEEIYEMEAPYFQELVPFGKYRNYVKGTQRNTLQGIKIFEIRQITDSYAEISMRLQFEQEGGKQETSDRKDRWVKAGDTWYHVIRDPIIFPSAS